MIIYIIIIFIILLLSSLLLHQLFIIFRFTLVALLGPVTVLGIVVYCSFVGRVVQILIKPYKFRYERG